MNTKMVFYSAGAAMVAVAGGLLLTSGAARAQDSMGGMSQPARAQDAEGDTAMQKAPGMGMGMMGMTSPVGVDERYIYVMSGDTILRIDKSTGRNAGTLRVGQNGSWNANGTLPRGGMSMVGCPMMRMMGGGMMGGGMMGGGMMGGPGMMGPGPERHGPGMPAPRERSIRRSGNGG